MRSDVFTGVQNVIISRCLYTCPPIVATFADVPDEVVGWVCRSFEQATTHYVYVKYPFRRTGIASALVHGTTEHTHMTRAGELLFAHIRSIFNPLPLYGAPTCRCQNSKVSHS